MSRNLILSVILALATLGFVAAGRANQDPPKAPEVQLTLFDAIDDLDKLRLLNPLKLTAAQLDKIIPLLKQRQKAYNERLAELAMAPLKGIADEILKTRAQLLSGGAIPQDLDEQIKRAQRDFVEKRKAEDDKNLKLVADGLRPILTTEQYKAIVAMARRDFEGLQGSDEQFYNLWVRETIIAYGRIVPLLEDMRKAREGKPSGTAGQ